MPLTTMRTAVPHEVDSARQAFIEAVAEILPERNAVMDSFNELVEKWNDHWGWFHRNVWNQDTYEDEKATIDSMRRDLNETPFPENTGGGSILDVADRVVAHHTPVVSLFLTSMGWVEDSMSPTSDVYADIWQPEHGRGLAAWDGEARAAYDDIVAQQRDSTAAARDLAAFMSGWLAGIAEDNVSYVTFLLEKLATIAAKIASTIAAVGTSGGLFSLLEAAELVGEMVGLAITHLGEIATRIASAVGRVIEAEAILTDHSYFPDGAWPAAVDRA